MLTCTEMLKNQARFPAFFLRLPTDFFIITQFPMIRNLIPSLFICLLSSNITAQNHSDRIAITPEEAELQQEAVEVQYYAQQLANLKAAYAAKDDGKIAVYESAVLMSMRNEINQLDLKIATHAAQAERRKLAGSGQLTQAATPEEAPRRDPLADATTPDEIRFETLTYTLAAFDRHAFDPSRPEDAAKDFAKLDAVLKIMEDALAELKARGK